MAKTDVLAGTRFDAGKTVVSVFIAGERDDTLVATTGTPAPQDTAESDTPQSSSAAE